MQGRYESAMRCFREKGSLMGFKDKKKKKQKFDYFDVLCKQAELASQEAALLIDILENFDGSANMEKDSARAHEIEHQGDALCHEIYNNLATEFITPIDREDLVALAHALDDVLDYCDGTVQCLYMFDVQKLHPEALTFARLLLKGTERLESTMKEFKHFKNSKDLRTCIIEVGQVEDEADQLYFDVTRSMHIAAHNGEMDFQELYVWSKVFKRLEDMADACERVADTAGTLAIKNV